MSGSHPVLADVERLETPFDNLTLVRERDFQQTVYDLARRLGWLAYHPWRSDHSAAGFPDLTMVKGKRVVFAELKREGKKPTAKQQEWLDALAVTGRVEVYLWWPSNWAAIVETLQVLPSRQAWDAVAGIWVCNAGL